MNAPRSKGIAKEVRMNRSNRSRTARKHPVVATPIGGESGTSRILRTRAASLNSSGSLLSMASRKASLLGRVSRSCPGGTRRLNPANCCATITLKGRKRAPGHLMSKGLRAASRKTKGRLWRSRPLLRPPAYRAQRICWFCSREPTRPRKSLTDLP